MNAAEKINNLGIRIDMQLVAEYIEGLRSEAPGYGREGMSKHARIIWIRMLENIGKATIEGILHPCYTQAGATSGRWTCKGVNFQNIPKELRGVFVPRDGHLFIKLDLCQVQYRIIAKLAGETKLLAAMAESDFDIHTTVSEDLGVSRDVAKVINFGILFGMTGYGVGQRCGKSELWGSGIIAAWNRKYGKIAQFIRSTKKAVVTEGRVSTPKGLERIFDTKDGKAQNQGVSHVVQGAEAEVVTAAVTRLQAAGHRVVIQCHDEVVIEVRDDSLVTEAQKVKDLWLEDEAYPLTTTAQVGTSWS